MNLHTGFLPAPSPLLYAADGLTLAEELEIQVRWAGYFVELDRVDRRILIFPAMLPLSGLRPPLYAAMHSHYGNEGSEPAESEKALGGCGIYTETQGGRSCHPCVVAHCFNSFGTRESFGPTEMEQCPDLEGKCETYE